jgi:hypothetical protein
MPEAIASMEELKVLVRDGSGNEMSKRFAF